MRPQLRFQHPRQISARQPHARHHVDLEEAAPVFIGNLEKLLGLENPGIVDEDVDLALCGDKRLAPGRGRHIGGDAPDLGARHRLGDRGGGCVDLALRPAIDRDLRARRGKSLGDGMADAGGRTRHQRGFSRKIDFHETSPSSRRGRYREHRARAQSPVTTG